MFVSTNNQVNFIFLNFILNIIALHEENEKLREHLAFHEKQCRDLMNKNRKLEQVAIARSDENRFYASKELGHYANDKEALMHYLEKKGAEGYAMAIRIRKAQKRHGQFVKPMLI